MHLAILVQNQAKRNESMEEVFAWRSLLKSFYIALELSHSRKFRVSEYGGGKEEDVRQNTAMIVR